MILLAFVLSAPMGNDACVIPPGPPCVSISDQRLMDPLCVFSVGSCISLNWDEYSSNSIVEEVLIVISPKCGDSSSALRLDRIARNYISEMQTIPVFYQSEFISCSSNGFVNVKILRSSTR